MLLVIDNYDSFTFNLVQYLGELGVDQQVHRNDQLTVEQALALRPERVLISPGPCSPREAGLSNDLIRAFSERGIPILGVCLGHQCIAHTFGAQVVVNYRMMHGKVSPIFHNGQGLFEGLPIPFSATRYHSLVAKRDTVPDILEVTAWTAEDEVMGLRHRHLPIHGVQFHPESVLSEHGRELLQNFLRMPSPAAPLMT
jgi:anthranilate synthase/aminodeoxychorismate synthase-like glutamine amidotransferase